MLSDRAALVAAARMLFGRFALMGAALFVSVAVVPSATAAPAADARDVQRWLAELSHRVPARREAAHRRLSNLSRPELDLLRDAIKDHARELAAQQDLLHDIVVQAFLATEPYGVDPLKRTGFMGVRFDDEQRADESPYAGVEIRHIMPGLCASKYLEEGDVLLSVAVDKDVRAVRSAQEVIEIIGSLPAGQVVKMTVIRRGRQLELDVKLGGRPPDIDQTQEQFEAGRQKEAEDYWADRFADLFNPPPPAPAPPAARASAADR